MQWFFEELERKLQLVTEQLDERLAIICKKKVQEFPLPHGRRAYGLTPKSWSWNDEVGEVLKHGTLSIGFIGLAETLKALRRRPSRRERGEPEPGPGDHRLHAQACGRELTQERKLNFTLLATPAEGSQRPVCAH